MDCPQCGRELPPGAQFCITCGAPAPAQGEAPSPAADQGWAKPVEPRTSGLATASLILGIGGIFTCGISSLVGLVLGFMGLSQINKSGGALTGRSMAITGIVVSLVFVLIMPFITLGAILFPVFSKARDKAREASCLSNVRQLATGMLMYATDYDDTLPRKSDWCDGVRPYIEGINPTPQTGQTGQSSVWVCPMLPGVRSGYAYNALLEQMRTGDIPTPRGVVALFDAKGGGWNLSGGPELLDPRHSHGANLSYVDGHAKWISAKDFGQLNFDPRVTMPEPPPTDATLNSASYPPESPPSATPSSGAP